MTLTPTKIVQAITEDYPQSHLPSWFWWIKDILSLVLTIGGLFIVGVQIYKMTTTGETKA